MRAPLQASMMRARAQTGRVTPRVPRASPSAGQVMRDQGACFQPQQPDPGHLPALERPALHEHNRGSCVGAPSHAPVHLWRQPLPGHAPQGRPMHASPTCAGRARGRRRCRMRQVRGAALQFAALPDRPGLRPGPWHPCGRPLPTQSSHWDLSAGLSLGGCAPDCSTWQQTGTPCSHM